MFNLFVYVCFFFSSRRRHTRYWRDWSSDVCSSDLSFFRLYFFHFFRFFYRFLYFFYDFLFFPLAYLCFFCKSIQSSGNRIFYFFFQLLFQNFLLIFFYTPFFCFFCFFLTKRSVFLC